MSPPASTVKVLVLLLAANTTLPSSTLPLASTLRLPLLTVTLAATRVRALAALSAALSWATLTSPAPWVRRFKVLTLVARSSSWPAALRPTMDTSTVRVSARIKPLVAWVMAPWALSTTSPRPWLLSMPNTMPAAALTAGAVTGACVVVKTMSLASLLPRVLAAVTDKLP